MTDFPRPPLSSALFYRDPKTAFRWLEQAFGFEPLMVISDDKGDPQHMEMSHEDGVIMIGPEWTDDHRSPEAVGGKNTQSVHVHLKADIDGHCERARAAGAEILMEPADQFYGDRSYRARDPEGHMWTFSQTVQEMTPAQWDKASGLITTTRLAE